MASSQPEVLELPETLIAVALDTNCMGRGRFSLERLAELVGVIQEQDLSIEILVPEPVVWEWAEHLYRDVATARTPYVEALAAARAAGVQVRDNPVSDELADVESTVAALQKALDEIVGVRVLALSDYPAAAMEGLRDQVLQLGAGRTKKDVKTGAADSTAFRLLASHWAKYGMVDVVLVSGDRDARAHFRGSDVLTVESVWTLKRSLMAMRHGSEIAKDQIAAAAKRDLPDFDEESLASVSYEGNGPRVTGVPLRGQVLAVSTKVTAVEEVLVIETVDVSRSDGYGTAYAKVLVTVAREVQWVNDHDDRVERDVDYFFEVPAEIQLSALREDPDEWSIELEHIVLT
jgi:hypothetical protein